MTDAELKELLAVIGLGYFHTYPGADANKQGLHDACEELRSRDLLEIINEEPGHVTWRRPQRTDC